MVILEEFISPQQVEVLRDTTYELEAQYRSTGELPGAMAARALYPDRAVILLSGDGSFTHADGTGQLALPAPQIKDAFCCL